MSILCNKLVAQNTVGNSPSGTDFWIASTYPFYSGDSFFVAVSSSKPTKAYLEIPGFNYIDSVSLGFNEIKYFLIPKSIRQSYYYYHSSSAQKIGNNGIHVRSTLPVKVYSFSSGTYYSSGATAVYPSNSQPPNGEYYPYKSRYSWSTAAHKYRIYFFTIVAIDDSTIVKFDVLNPSTTIIYNRPIGDSVFLRKGQTARLYMWSVNQSDESRMVVKATKGKRISVFTENFYDIEDGTTCWQFDLMYEQMLPENLLGKEFILTPIKFLKKGYNYSVCAVQDSTSVYKNGTFIKMLKQAEIYYGSVGKDSCALLTTSKPVTCWEKISLDTCTSGWYWQNGGISLFTVNANEQMVTDANVMIPITDDYPSNFMNIVVPKIGKDSLYVDGDLITVSQMKSILGGNYYFYTDSMPKGNIRVLNKYGFYAYAYGRGIYGGYAYNASSGLKSLKPVLFAKVYKSCDTGYLVKVWTEGVPVEDYNWSWNGIAKDTGKNTILYVPKVGIYTLGLRYQRLGSSVYDSVYMEVQVKGNEQYNFIPARSQNICKKEYKVELPYSKILDYTWEDGTKVRKRTITTSGNYRLKVENVETKCFLYDTIDVAFYDTIKAKIAFTQSSQCPGVPIYLSSTSSTGAGDSIVNYKWYIDGLPAGNYKKDTIPYSYPGIYKFKLRISNKAGCVDSAFAETYVSAIPKLIVGTISLDSCAGTSNIRFNSRSSLVEGKIAGYRWFFSDGDTGDISYNWKQTVRNFKKAGKQGYRFSAFTEQGCADTTPWKYVNVYGGPLPLFEITDSSVCKSGNYFTIKNNTPQKDSSKLFVWLWGDGSGTTLTDPGYKTYDDTGTYRIQMAGVDPKNMCGGDTSVRIVRVLQSPDAKIVTDSSNFCLNNNYYALSDGSESVASSFKQTIWKWSATNKDTTTTRKGLIKFNKTGTYSITMYHSLGKGCVDSAKKNLVVFGSPTARFTVSDSQFCAPKTSFTLNNTSTTIGSSTYRWKGPTWNYTTKDVGVQSLPDSGTHTVRLIVRDQLYGCEDTIVKTLIVHPNPSLEFTVSDTLTCFPGKVFTFEDISNVKIDSSVTRFWKIGTDTFMRFPFLYNPSSKGVKTAQLVYTKASLCKDTISKKIEVLHNTDSVTITGGLSKYCVPAQLTFNANTFAGELWNFTWEYGSNSNVAASPYSILFSNSGNQQVLVRAKLNQCEMRDSMVVQLLNKPIVSISAITDTIQCVNTQQFELLASAINVSNPVDYSWQVTQNTSSTNTLKPSFNAAGKYQATVFVNDYYNCKDTASILLEVKEKPKVIVANESACMDESKVVPFTVQPAGYQLSNYNWYVDGSLVSNSNPYTHLFNSNTIEQIQLISSGVNGCVDTSNLAQLFSIAKPVASFTALMKNSTSAGVPLEFTNTSSNFNRSEWDLDNGSIDTNKNPFYLYSNLGNKKIVLTVYNSSGCYDTAQMRIFVTSDALGFIPTAFSPNIDGLNETFKPAELSAVNEYEMKVFNRWGQLMFSSTDPLVGWDGTFNNSLVPDGVYAVRIYARFITGAVFLHTGPLTIIR